MLSAVSNVEWDSVSAGSFSPASAGAIASIASRAWVTGEDAALTMGDGVSVSFKPFYGGHDPANSVDRAIRATRNAIFPSLGLDPLTD